MICVWNIDLLTFKVAPSRQTAELWQSNRSIGMSTESVHRMCCYVRPHVRIDIKLWVFIWTAFMVLLNLVNVETSTSSCRSVVDAQWLGWVGFSLAVLAWYVPNHPLIQPVGILDQTGGLWWWQGQWASHSHNPTPPPPIAAYPFASLPHCRVIWTVTLYERGDDKRIYTQSLAKECISFVSRVWAWMQKDKS